MNIPQLQHFTEFEAVLRDYHMSIEAQHILSNTPLVLMVAATSSGRNTIINELLQTGRYYFIVSDTTRPPRSNNGVPEQNGIEYFFRSEEEMLADIKKGRFIEAALIHNQQVSGVSVREIEKARTQGKIAIADVNPDGAHHIVQLKPDVLVVFVVPPNFEVWLQRLKSRNSMSTEELLRRLTSALHEFEAALQQNYYLYVINDDLEDAVEQVDNIARFDKVSTNTQLKAKQVLEQLIKDTQTYINVKLS